MSQVVARVTPCSSRYRQPHITSCGKGNSVLLSTNANVGEGLVKCVTCSDIPGHWMDVWTYEAVGRLSEPKKHHLMLTGQSFRGR